MSRLPSGGLAVCLFVLAAAACAPAAAPPAAPAAKAAPSPATQPAAAPATQPAPAPAANPAPFDEKAVADFYRGKTVRMVICCSPGGSYDLVARMVARHMRRHVPGNPTIVVENRPGAGGLLAGNAVYATEPRDGSVIGLLPENLVLMDAVGAAGVQFDAASFNWLGSSNSSPYGCMVRTELGISSIQQVIAGEQVTIAATSPGTALHDTAAILNGTLGTNFKIVPGYGGGADTRLAMDRGEADGICSGLESMVTIDLHRLEGESASARVLVIMGDKTPDYPFLRGVPAAETLAKTDEARRLLQAVNAPTLIGRPMVAPPEVPRERVEALRKALADTLVDPQLRTEADRSGFTITPTSGEEVSRIVRGVKGMPPETLAKLKEMLKY